MDPREKLVTTVQPEGDCGLPKGRYPSAIGYS
jgi:hypothetical protein